MSIWRNNLVNSIRLSILAAAIVAGILVAGCSTASRSPGPAQASNPPGSQPPEEMPAQVPHPVLPPTLSEAELAKVCHQAPETCSRIRQTQPLTFADLEVLGRLAISPGEIIEQVKHTRTIYYLTADDIIALKKAGLGDKVINFLVDTPKTVAHATP
jgi:hypothetical protein